MLAKTDGVIFNTQSYSLQDGPGLRTTIFMKGCPLHCAWCHNPESINPSPELMIYNNKCVACGKCAVVCKPGAISIGENGRHIDRSKCVLCFDCINACARGALEKVGKPVDIGEVVSEIEKDEVFYRRSGGGVTISGGEPLAQPRFLKQILQACKERNLLTALDTSGFTPWPVSESVIDMVDLWLYDVKHMDPERHKKGTGVDNSLILENLRKIPHGKKIWLRVPLMSGYNDSVENIRRTVELGLEIHAEKLSLLVYHDYAVSKYAALGKEYRFAGTRPPHPEHIAKLVTLSETMGLNCTVGF